MSAFRLLTLLLAFLFTICGANAGERIALVIGNANFPNLPSIATAGNDAKDLAAALSKVGFEVDLRNDLNRADTLKALDGLKPKSEKAEIVFVYLAGHGLEMAGNQFFVPVDAKLASAANLESEGINLETILAPLADMKGTAIVVLDTSRDNPLPASASLPADLPDLSQPRNLVILFATSAGKKVVEGRGRNSALAHALLTQLAEPGHEISTVLRKVRDEVIRETGGEQSPFFYAALAGASLYLVPPK